MFKITAFPASYGDSLWVEYGDEANPNIILIDAGPSVPKPLKTRLEALAARGGHLELVVVTHVDRDHIGGMLKLLENNFYGVQVRDIWFNGFRHLPAPESLEVFGEKQGEQLTKLLLEKRFAWNVAVEGEGLMVTPQACPSFVLPGGAKIILLSPDAAQLSRLRANWVKVCGEADLYADLVAATDYFGGDGALEAFGAVAIDVPTLAAQAFKEDAAEANGSSIAFIIEYGGKRALLGADAYPSRILKSLERLEKSPYRFDLVKVPHHGSENNISKEFVEVLECQRYLFCSDGAIYKHPSQPAVARVVQYGNCSHLLFNCRSRYSEVWDDQLLQSMYSYEAYYGNDDGIAISL